MQALLFTRVAAILCFGFSCPSASLYLGEACVTRPSSLPFLQDKHAEEVRKNKELKEEASR